MGDPGEAGLGRLWPGRGMALATRLLGRNRPGEPRSFFAGIRLALARREAEMRVAVPALAIAGSKPIRDSRI
jgi:hypothetical protein